MGGIRAKFVVRQCRTAFHNFFELICAHSFRIPSHENSEKFGVIEKSIKIDQYMFRNRTAAKILLRVRSRTIFSPVKPTAVGRPKGKFWMLFCS